MKYLCLLLYVTCATCFYITEESRFKEKIRNKKVRRINKISHQAAFEYDGKFKSSATIISPTWLITVAHVFANCYDIEIRGKIRTGTPFKESGGSLFRIKRVVPHPEFDLDTFTNNLLLIELGVAIPFNRNQKAVHVAEPYEDDITGIKMRIAQLRQAEDIIADASRPKLMHVQVTSDDVCSSAYANAQRDKIFCTRKLDATICNRDYGGGVVFYAYLFGVSATVDDYCDDYPSAAPIKHIKVSEYYVWISRTANLAYDA